MTDDVLYFKRFFGNPITNVPRLVIHHSPDGFEWGYGGSGPADLALNILEMALRKMNFDGKKVPCYRGNCFELAWNLHQQFKWEFITKLSKDSENYISMDDVYSWIKQASNIV